MIIISAFPLLGMKKACEVHGWQNLSITQAINGVLCAKADSGVVVVDANIEIREALGKAKVPYLLAIPTRLSKEFHIKNAIEEGYSDVAIIELDTKWNAWQDSWRADPWTDATYILERGEFLVNHTMLLKRIAYLQQEGGGYRGQIGIKCASR